MKTNTHEEISFTNCYVGLHLNKNEGTIAIDFKSNEIVLYLNTSLYQSVAWLVTYADQNKTLMDYVTWTVNPKLAGRNSLIEVHGPEHSACLVCSPSHERVQLNLEIGVSIDLKFSDFKGLLELIKEAQNDLEWRRLLLKWTLEKDIGHGNESKDKDKKAL